MVTEALVGEIVFAGDGQLAEWSHTADPIATLVDRWIAAVTQAKPSTATITAYRGDIAIYLAWCESRDVDPLHVVKTHIDMYAGVIAHEPSERTGRPLARATIARRISSVASFYGYLVDEDVVPSMPVRKRVRPKVPNVSTTRGLSRDEARLVSRRLMVESTSDRAIVRTLLIEGLRAEELCALNVGSIGINAGHVTMTVVGKGGRERELVAGAPVVQAVDEMLTERAAARGVAPADLDPDEPLFVRVVGGLVVRHSDRSLARIVQRIARAAGLVKPSTVTPHVFRHTCATLMRDAGIPLDVVRDHLGHASIETTQRYERTRNALARSGVHALAAFIDSEEGM